MSDYFLNKIYDSLIKRNLPQTKTSFRTLSESYTKIYEQTPSPTHDDPLQVPNPETPVTADILPPASETSVSSETVNWNKDTTQTTLVAWSGLQAAMYRKEDAKTAAGPGEYSVASLISEETNEEVLGKMISGGNKSYDVSYPSAEDPKAIRFEVKQEETSEEEGSDQATKDVRIAKLGTNIAKKITESVDEILFAIRDEYELLTPENQSAVNQAILEKLGEITKPEPGTTPSGKPRLQPSSKETKKYEQQVAQRQEWTVSKFVNTIGARNGELVFTYLFEDKFQQRKSNRKFRGIFTLMSLERFAEICNEIGTRDVKETEEDESTERVQGIKSTFKRFYGTSSEEKNKVLDDTFEKEAENVDKRLIKAKIKQTKEGGKNVQEFFNDLKKEKLQEKINNLKEYITNPKTVRSMFPDGTNDPVSIQGLFVVDPKGWKYITSNDIGNSIAITRISMNKPKIVIKR